MERVNKDGFIVNTTDKIYIFDTIRVVAMTAIVISHFMEYTIGGTMVGELGRYLGGCGVVVFFLLSALLFGLRWEATEKLPFPIGKFMKKRIIRIGCPLWVYLIGVVLLFVASGVPVPWIDFGLNLCFLGYLGRLPGNPHLWFVTVIMLCYLEFVILSKYKINVILGTILLVLSLVGYYIFQSKGLPGHIFLTLGMCGLMFCFARNFMDFVVKIPHKIILGGAFWGLNIYAIWLFENNLFDTHRLVAFPLYRICGLSWMILMIWMLPNRRIGMINYLSTISFEIYIVHQMLCRGPLLTVDMISGSRTIQFISLLVISFILAVILHFVSNKLMNLLLRVAR